jgi:adapter protein MecA 1/2
MKIEKINSNQIKCFLNKNDLSTRHIKVSELAYGTEKAQELFRDMMDQASDEVGFDVTDAPLMIEAVPLSTDSIMLIITKVDNPEELENKFTSLPDPDSRKFVKKLMNNETDTSSYNTYDETPSGISAFFVYTFKQFDDIAHVSEKLVPFKIDNSILYKNRQDGLFYLVLLSNEMDRKDTKIIRGILAEYANQLVARKTIISHFDEHYEVII